MVCLVIYVLQVADRLLLKLERRKISLLCYLTEHISTNKSLRYLVLILAKRVLVVMNVDSGIILIQELAVSPNYGT